MKREHSYLLIQILTILLAGFLFIFFLSGCTVTVYEELRECREDNIHLQSLIKANRGL